MENVTNLHLSATATRGKESIPAPSPYEERFLIPTMEQDQQSGLNYYSDATYTRITGARSESMDRLIANDKDDQMDTVSLRSEIRVTDGESEPEEEGVQEKRERGKRPTIGEYVGIREKREEEQAQKKEAEQE